MPNKGRIFKISRTKGCGNTTAANVISSNDERNEVLREYCKCNSRKWRKDTKYIFPARPQTSNAVITGHRKITLKWIWHVVIPIPFLSMTSSTSEIYALVLYNFRYVSSLQVLKIFTYVHVCIHYFYPHDLLIIIVSSFLKQN